jgi:hypothetical protein
MSTERRYFYDLDGNRMGHHAAILIAGIWCVEYTNETLDQYKTNRPSQNFSELYAWEEYEQIMSDHDRKCLIDPIAKKVDEERYWYMLNVLPPARWHTTQGIELFHLSERLTGNIVSWIARFHNSYFEFAHYANATDETLIAKVLEAVNAK